ncbi:MULTISPECIES: ABC transporter ATP-binding protein [Microbacterium]|uniref:ABC transporter ATP-binding protein n=1 Tax=Microbacterium wangchenii TaxID=2541726 RepID=A0ABX5SVJ2_9MICO|nr:MULTISPECIES: ABC transporter ATP-binding protein [Microbacterium]MCK6065877.1 ABC transporter ATP-binding protein [Microbacterium sp. EYE_512]QBR90181.1 ABC transporter ATP-binding protein [Microbacterium wangchenii]TFV85008.1 ABC transporter ATP-binding protein [Microbacterium sp. dk485]TXK11803.1 ABC transporter ATP-binding protein [Microbacterium wangchenii]
MSNQATVAGAEQAGEEQVLPRLRIRGVGRDFHTKAGVTHAVSGIDLDIERGEFVALIGRSGCGKTTLLRMIGGLLSPTSGTIEVDGRHLWRNGHVESSAVTRLGFVFQESNLFPWFTVLDNIALPLKLRGVDKAARRQRATELAALVGLSGFEKSYPRELSGGMRQRAAIARALSTKPDLLLMDEPFGALDALTRERMNLELQRIVLETGSTVVFVTHDIPEAVFLADRVVHMTPRPGRIRQILSVPDAKPRGIELQTTPGFNDIVRNLRHDLDEED